MLWIAAYFQLPRLPSPKLVTFDLSGIFKETVKSTLQSSPEIILHSF